MSISQLGFAPELAVSVKSVTAGRIAFADNSSAAYEETLAFTWGGVGGTVNLPISAQLVGQFVSIALTSNLASVGPSFTGFLVGTVAIPEVLRPVDTVVLPIMAIQNGIQVVGGMVVGSDGIITFELADASAFVAGSNQGPSVGGGVYHVLGA
jgi:hypothetical protein